MAVGFGAGINLGSATAYLFVDGSGLRRGLNQAQRDMQNFERKQKAAASALEKSTLATSTRDVANARAALAEGGVFKRLQEDAAKAARAATDQINRSYQTRLAALQRYGAASQGIMRRIRQQEEELTRAIAERDRLAKRQKSIEDTLALPSTDTRRPVAGSRPEQRLKDELSAIRATNGAMDQVNAKIARAQSEIRRYQGLLTSTTNAVKNAVVNANNAQQTSITNLESALRRQVTAYRGLAAGAGPQFAKLADTVERTAKRVITTTQSLAKAQTDLSRAQQARASATGSALARAVAAEEAANNRVKNSLYQVQRARTAHIRSEQAFTNAFVNEAKRREKAAEQESQRLIAAQQAEAQARATQRQNTLAAGMDVATTAAFGLAGAVSKATKEFTSYEESLLNAASISQDIQNDFEGFSNQIEDLAVQLGKSPTELAEGLYEIAQAGFEGKDAFAILTEAAEASVAGITDVETAARPLIGVINAYGLEVEDAARISDVLFEAVTEGIFSFQDLATQIGDNLSIASALDVSLEELAASYVVLTKRSNSLAETTTQVNAVMNAFLKPSEALNQAIQDLTGETAQLFFRTHSLGDVLQVVQHLFSENADAAGALFPNIRALRGVFGLTGDELVEFNKQLGNMEGAAAGAGATADVLAVQMEGTAFKFRQAREQIRLAFIDLGEAAAPGLLLVAKLAAGAADLFTKLPGPIQSAVGGLAAFSVVSLTALVAMVKFVDASGAAISATRDLAKSLRDSGKAMIFFRVATNPFLLAGVGIAAIAYTLIKQHRQHAAGVKQVEDAYKSLEITLTNLQAGAIGNLTPEEVSQLDAMGREIKAILENQKSQVGALNEEWQLLTGAITEFAGQPGDFEFFNTITGEMITLDEARSRIADIEVALKNLEINATSPALQQALDRLFTLEDLDAASAIATIEPLIPLLEAGVINADQLADVINHGIDTGQFVTDLDEADQILTSLGDQANTLDEFFGSAADKANALRQGLKGLVDSAFGAVGLTDDFSSPLAFLQQRLGAIGESTAQVLLRMEQLGHIQFTGAERSALRAQAAIDNWAAEIARVNQQISDSQGRMSQWEQTIDLVATTIGTEADGYAGLQSLVERYNLSAEEANEIREAAIFLNERSKIGIEDERLAIARSLPDLAAFVNQHDKASKRFEELSPEARGFAAAISDVKNQTILLTAVMLKLVEAMNPDAFPPEFATKFIFDVSQADPEMAAIFDKIGLLPEELQTTYVFEVDESIDTLEEVYAAIKDVNKRIEAELAEPSPDENKLTRLNAEAQALEERKLDLSVSVGVSGGGQLPKLISGIADATELTEEEVGELEQAWENAFDAMEQGTDEISISLANAIPELLRASGAVEDFSDPLKFLTKNWDDVDASIENVLLHYSRMEDVGLNLTQDEREALRLASALGEVERELVNLDESIQNNQDDMAMWQNRIDLVEETIGTEEDGYERLNQLAQVYGLTQEEINEIRQAGIFITQRSQGGILDERLEIARSLPDLANYIALHDNLDSSYDSLSDGQKGFLAALKDESVQTAITTAIMLKQMESMGLAAEGTADAFIKAAAAANPAFEAFAKNVGLIPDEKTVKVSVVFSQGQTQTLKELGEQLGVLRAAEEVLRVKLAEDPNNEAVKAELNGVIQQILTIQQATARVIVEAVTGKAYDDIASLRDVVLAANEDGTITIIGDTSDVDAATKELEALGFDPKKLVVQAEVDPEKTPTKVVQEATPTEPVSNVPVAVTATATTTGTEIPDQTFEVHADTSSAVASVQQMRIDVDNELVGLREDAALLGSAAAIAWSAFFASSLAEYSVLVSDAIYINGPIPILSRSIQYFGTLGEYAGLGFDYGIAKGMYSGQGTAAIVQAARYVAFLAYAAALTALIIRSPSQRGVYIGEQFVFGAAQGVYNAAPTLVSAAKSVALQASSAFAASLTAGDLSILGAGASFSASKAPLPSIPSGSRSASLAVNFDVRVSGAGNPDQTAQAVTDQVWQKLHGSLRLLEAQIAGSD